jgi:hypothetical protein
MSLNQLNWTLLQDCASAAYQCPVEALLDSVQGDSFELALICAHSSGKAHASHQTLPVKQGNKEYFQSLPNPALMEERVTVCFKKERECTFVYLCIL